MCNSEFLKLFLKFKIFKLFFNLSDCSKFIIEILSDIDKSKHEEFLETLLDDLSKRNRRISFFFKFYNILIDIKFKKFKFPFLFNNNKKTVESNGSLTKAFLQQIIGEINFNEKDEK